MSVKVQFGIGHCRKRKIRCKKPEVKDLLNRCESCINLKKDCVYTAVNPQPQPHTMTHRPRRVSIGSNPASPTTSPATAIGHIVEGQSNPAYHQLTAIPSVPNIGQHPVETGEDETYSVGSMCNMNLSLRPYGYKPFANK